MRIHPLFAFLLTASLCALPVYAHAATTDTDPTPPADFNDEGLTDDDLKVDLEAEFLHLRPKRKPSLTAPGSIN